MTRTRAIVAFLAALLIPAAGVRADSLVYAKGGDIWRAAPDGHGALKLTSGGDFVSPSQADDGTIVATDQRSGESCRRQIVRLSSSGKLLARLSVVGPSLPGMSALGPWYPQVSSDGTRVAFGESLIDSDRWSIICLGYGSIQQEHITVANAQTGKRIGMITVTGTNLWTPSWLADGRVLAFAPYTLFGFQAGYGSIDQELTRWFSDPKETPDEFMTRRNISDGEISPNGSQIAYIAGENTPAPDQLPTIEIASITGLGATPAVQCDVPITHPPAENPSWSPNGTSLAWSEQDGIHVTPIAGGTAGCAASPHLMVPGGLHPDWGPYSGSGISNPRLAVDVAHSVTRAALLHTGIAVRATCTAACRLEALLTVARGRGRPLVLGHASVQLRRAGTVTLHIRLASSVRRYATRGATLQLRVVAYPGGARTYTVRVR